MHFGYYLILFLTAGDTVYFSAESHDTVLSTVWTTDIGVTLIILLLSMELTFWCLSQIPQRIAAANHFYCSAVPCRSPTYYLQLTCVLWQDRNCFINMICFVKVDFCLACSAPLYILNTDYSKESSVKSSQSQLLSMEKEQNTHPVCYYC